MFKEFTNAFFFAIFLYSYTKRNRFLLADIVLRDIRLVPENLKQNHVIVEYRLPAPEDF